jgi:hypothetical protein
VALRLWRLSYQSNAKAEAVRADIIVEQVFTVPDEALTEDVEIGAAPQQAGQRIGNVVADPALAAFKVEPRGSGEAQSVVFAHLQEQRSVTAITADIRIILSVVRTFGADRGVD